MAYVILKCISENAKLRIRFHAYVNADNVTLNPYNDKYNCRFPRHLRTLGKFYRVPASDVSLNSKNKPFYCVKPKNIQVLDSYDSTSQIYSAEQCVICFDCVPEVTFLPCGHNITCANCYDRYKVSKDDCPDCPLCRQNVDQVCA